MAEPPTSGYRPFRRTLCHFTVIVLLYSCLFNATFPSFMYIYFGLFFYVHFKVARCLWHVAHSTYVPCKLSWGRGGRRA